MQSGSTGCLRRRWPKWHNCSRVFLFTIKTLQLCQEEEIITNPEVQDAVPATKVISHLAMQAKEASRIMARKPVAKDLSRNIKTAASRAIETAPLTMTINKLKNNDQKAV